MYLIQCDIEGCANTSPAVWSDDYDDMLSAANEGWGWTLTDGDVCPEHEPDARKRDDLRRAEEARVRLENERAATAARGEMCICGHIRAWHAAMNRCSFVTEQDRMGFTLAICDCRSFERVAG